MKKRLLILIIVIISLNSFAQAQIVNCNNVTYSTDTFYISDSNNILYDTIYYNDSIAIAYPLHCLHLSDTSIISATSTFATDSCFIFTGLAQNSFDDTVHFEYLITFHSTTFANNTIVNGYFHLLKTGLSNDTIADCYFPVTIILQNTTGVSEIEENEKINIYPNPVSSEMNIENNSGHPIHFILYNSLSEKLIEKILTSKTSKINLSAYSTDIYFYKVSSNMQLFKSGTIIKQ